MVGGDGEADKNDLTEPHSNEDDDSDDNDNRCTGDVVGRPDAVVASVMPSRCDGLESNSVSANALRFRIRSFIADMYIGYRLYPAGKKE